jgi:hypothetical protein
MHLLRLALPLLLACWLPAQEPEPLPVGASATVDTANLPATGRAVLQLAFTAEAPLAKAYSIRIELRHQRRVVQRREHAPPTPTTQWAKATPVTYDLAFGFPVPPDEVPAGTSLGVFLAFFDPATEQLVPIASPAAGNDRFAQLTEFVLPDLTAEPDANAVEALITAALASAAKDPTTAWDQLEFTFRRVTAYPLKAKLQKALTQVGRMPPAAIRFEERDIIAGRIAEERARYLREVAGRMFDQGRLLGALLLLDEVGGSLQEQANRAVLGSLAEAQRVTQDRDGILAKVFALDEEQKASLRALQDKHSGDRERLDVGTALGKKPATRAVGRELVRSLEYVSTLKEPAKAAREAIEKAWLADVPAAERAEAEAAMQHACWARTSTRQSHRFVLIGPRDLLAGIPADSLLRFDLAYLYLTDLFGRVPNPDGDRVTVYWKELWDFGGGIGGGKIIDIGNADPAAKSLRVDNGLLYHELTHCVDDTAPIYAGLREGLADFGAAFCMMELGQAGAGRAAIGMATRAFLQDYLARDLEYWRIPNYGPSAGLLLHFITTYGKDGEGYRWDRYRQFFRDYRKDPIKDERAPNIARAFAFHLAAAFGPPVYDDLQRFRWPLLPSDPTALEKEQRAARTRAMPDFDTHPGSLLPRDRVATMLHDEQAELDAHARELGVVKDWWVIGPFRKQGVDPDTFRFPPELEIDLQARYDSINNNPTWRRPGNKPVLVDATGWLDYQFAYMDDSAIYALTHITVDRDVEAWFWLSADDDLTLLVDDELIGKFDFQRGRTGPWRPNRRVHLPDAIRFPVKLTKGRHKVLVKVRNGGGAAGLSLAIADRNGLPLVGWHSDVEPPAKKLAAIDWPDGAKWSSKWKAKFSESSAVRKLETTVGSFRVRNGALEGFANAREVEWRKYTVRPGFPKDSPSNLAWLPEKVTEALTTTHLVIDLAPGNPPPKLGVILQGDGQRDALCGWTLLLEPQGDRVRAYLERYDLRVHMSDLVPWQADDKKPKRLVLQYYNKRLSVQLGDQVLFDQAPLLPIPGKHQIGVVTWGENLRIEAMELRGMARTK